MFRRLLVACVLVASALAPSAHAASDGNAHTTRELYITQRGGPQLHAFVYRPARLPANARTPVILNVGPYLNSGGSLLGPAPIGPGNTQPPAWIDSVGQVFRRGYTYVAVALPGFGSSGGCSDFGGPIEQHAVKSAIDWAASQPWSTGKVGMAGFSYDGVTALMGLGSHAKGLAAIVTMKPYTGYRNFFMNGVPIEAGVRLYPTVIQVYDLWLPSLLETGQVQRAIAGDVSNPLCYERNIASVQDPNPGTPFWRARELVHKLAGTRVPTFVTGGFADFNARPSNIVPLWNALRGPRRLMLGPWTHTDQGVATKAFMREVMAWFDRYLKGARVTGRPPVLVQDMDGKYRAETAWPPADATRYAVPLRAGRYEDRGGNSSVTKFPEAYPVMSGVPVTLPTGIGIWSVTRAAGYRMHLAGEPRVTVRVGSSSDNAHLVAMVYDIDATGHATLVSRGAYLVPRSGTYTFTLYPNDWRFAIGHRIGVLASGADDAWFEPGMSNSTVTVRSGSVSLPFLRYKRDRYVPKEAFVVSADKPPPFVVDKATMRASTVKAKLPPPMR